MKSEGGERAAFTHLDSRGNAHMVDVSSKMITERRAVAHGYLQVSPDMSKAGPASNKGVSARDAFKASSLAPFTLGNDPAAKGWVRALLASETWDEALRSARLAGIYAAKMTYDLIPLCHQIELATIEIDVKCLEDEIAVRALLLANERTGVEMEALSACLASLLSLYASYKDFVPGLVISRVVVTEKSGGKTGSWLRQDDGSIEHRS